MLNEAVDEAKKMRKNLLVLKVDFAKAYDLVEWGYLMDMLLQMNFPSRWLRWIYGCISSASANVLVNGSPSGEFALEKGI